MSTQRDDSSLMKNSSSMKNSSLMESSTPMKSSPLLKSSSPIESSSLIKVYVCSPYRVSTGTEADMKQERKDNDERVRKACRLLALMGYMPMAPHYYFTRFLSDDNPDERKQGMNMGMKWLEESDELWVFSERVSNGMYQEISRAKELNIPVRYVAEPDELIRQMYNALRREISQ